MKNKTIFVVQGYDEKMDDGGLKNVVVYELYAQSEDEAIEKAKKLLSKNAYRVSSIIEK